MVITIRVIAIRGGIAIGFANIASVNQNESIKGKQF